MRRQGVRTLQEGLAREVSGLLAVLGGPARPSRIGLRGGPQHPTQAGRQPEGHPRGWRLSRPSRLLQRGLGTWDGLVAWFNQLDSGRSTWTPPTRSPPVPGHWSQRVGLSARGQVPIAGSTSPPTAPSVLNFRLEDPEVALKGLFNATILSLGPSRVLFCLFCLYS